MFIFSDIMSHKVLEAFLFLWSAPDSYISGVSLRFDFYEIHSACACTLQKYKDTKIYLEKKEKRTRNQACNDALHMHGAKQLTLRLCFEPAQLAVAFQFTLTWGCCINHLVSHSLLVSCFYTFKPSFWRGILQI